jgi:hypothetical protein
VQAVGANLAAPGQRPQERSPGRIRACTALLLGRYPNWKEHHGRRTRAHSFSGIRGLLDHSADAHRQHGMGGLMGSALRVISPQPSHFQAWCCMKCPGVSGCPVSWPVARTRSQGFQEKPKKLGRLSGE